MNRELKGLKSQLSELYEQGQLDGFGLFLYGIVLRDMDQKEKAVTVLVESVNVYPWNWSAWKTLVREVYHTRVRD